MFPPVTGMKLMIKNDHGPKVSCGSELDLQTSLWPGFGVSMEQQAA